MTPLSRRACVSCHPCSVSLDVSNAEPLADSRAQERERVVSVGFVIAEDREAIADCRIAIRDLTRVHGVSDGHQHRPNFEPVPHTVGIGDHDHDGRDGRVVEVDPEAVSQLLVETAVATVAHVGHGN